MSAPLVKFASDHRASVMPQRCGCGWEGLLVSLPVERELVMTRLLRNALEELGFSRENDVMPVPSTATVRPGMSAP